MTDPLDMDRLAEKIAERLLRGAPDDRPLLTYEQAGERLGLSARTVRERVEAGELEAVTVGKSRRRIEPAAVDRFIAARRGA